VSEVAQTALNWLLGGKKGTYENEKL